MSGFKTHDMRKWCFYFQSLHVVSRFYSNSFQEIMVHERGLEQEEKSDEVC